MWDGNEVWLLVAGGATFAAFPEWYATLFSGFYLALTLILVSLIVRVMALEYRNKNDDPAWRRRWDAAIVASSATPALLWGVAFANIVGGSPLAKDGSFAGNFLDLLRPYTILGGATTLLLFCLHGAHFLALRTEGPVRERAHAVAARLWLPTVPSSRPSRSGRWPTPRSCARSRSWRLAWRRSPSSRSSRCTARGGRAPRSL